MNKKFLKIFIFIFISISLNAEDTIKYKEFKYPEKIEKDLDGDKIPNQELLMFMYYDKFKNINASDFFDLKKIFNADTYAKKEVISYFYLDTKNEFTILSKTKQANKITYNIRFTEYLIGFDKNTEQEKILGNGVWIETEIYLENNLFTKKLNDKLGDIAYYNEPYYKFVDKPSTDRNNLTKEDFEFAIYRDNMGMSHNFEKSKKSLGIMIPTENNNYLYYYFRVSELNIEKITKSQEPKEILPHVAIKANAVIDLMVFDKTENKEITLYKSAINPLIYLTPNKDFWYIGVYRPDYIKMKDINK